MLETKFYKCTKCGNVITVVDPKCPGLSCCGQAMTELKANTSDGAMEKHVPVVTVSGDTVEVNVGSVDHPMENDHYIVWVYVQTDKGGLRKDLLPSEKPHASFTLNGEKAVAVYEYCNKHGLWKKDLQ